MRLPIGKSLTDDAGDSALGALFVIYASADAVAIAEIKFREIAVQMFFSAMLIGALHAPLEN